MTHSIYTREQLQGKKLSELKAIASSLGVEAQDKRVGESWINAIVAHQSSQTEKLSKGIPQIDEQEVAQSELNTHIDQQAQDIARLELNQQGYQDAIALLPMQSNDPCYRMGYDRGIRDNQPQVEDVSSQAVAFEVVGKNIYGKIWGATVDNIEIRIIPVHSGYHSNLTSDQLFVDFGLAVKESLLAVAKLQAETMEVYFQSLIGSQMQNQPTVHTATTHGQKLSVLLDTHLMNSPPLNGRN